MSNPQPFKCPNCGYIEGLKNNFSPNVMNYYVNKADKEDIIIMNLTAEQHQIPSGATYIRKDIYDKAEKVKADLVAKAAAAKVAESTIPTPATKVAPPAP